MMTINAFQGPSKSRLIDAQAAYDPSHLLDSLITILDLKNDAALSRALDIAPPVISKIRHRRLAVGPSILIQMHEASDLTIRELRAMMGDFRENHFIGQSRFGRSRRKGGAPY